MEEIFKPIIGYETYLISTFGNVKNNKSGRILKNRKDKLGYLSVIISKNEVKKYYLIHRLVAITFIENLEQKLEVDHIDNNKINNNFTNLRWCSRQENMQNRQIATNNTSGIKGVCWNKRQKKWNAQICFNRQQIHIGSYDTIEEAAFARQEQTKQLFGNFINTCEKH